MEPEKHRPEYSSVNVNSKERRRPEDSSQRRRKVGRLLTTPMAFQPSNGLLRPFHDDDYFLIAMMTMLMMMVIVHVLQ